jgi:hypothetical protein
VKWNQRLVWFAFDDGPPPGRRDAEDGEGGWSAAIAYWESRGFRCATVGADRLVGRRGSWWGNVSSFDVHRLVCDVDVRREGARGWSVRLLLEGAFQYLTEWDLGALALETLLFRRALLGLPPPPELDRYRKETRRAAVVGSLSLSLLGTRLPKVWRQLIAQYAAPYDPPSVERVRA